MKYAEYNEEGVNLTNLETTFIPTDLYQNIHEHSVIVCHDVFIRCEYKNTKGLLLVTRLREPAKDVLWPIGGRALRGVPTELSLIKKAQAECNLTINNIEYLGTARTFFGGEPFGHNHGTDTLNIVYIATGTGILKLDPLHDSPYILTKEMYIKKDYKVPLYVEDFLNIINEKDLWRN